MNTSPDSLGPLQFRAAYSYDKKTPTLVCSSTGGSDEIVRWVLDRQDILYQHKMQSPPFCESAANRLVGGTGPDNLPVLIRTDALLYGTDSIVDYIEGRSLPSNRLIPADPAKKSEVMVLYNLFRHELEGKVTRYVYTQLLPEPSLARGLFTQGMSVTGKWRYRWGYGSIRKTLYRSTGGMGNGEDLHGINDILDRVDSLLKDGRKYLAGAVCSLADIAFAAIAAPLVLPEEFGGAICRINQVPAAWRTNIIGWRDRPSGQFILRLYQEDRPVMRPQTEILKEPNTLGRLAERIQLLVSRRQTSLFCFLQKRFPVLKVWFTSLVSVNQNDLLVEMLQRDEDFTIEEINGRKMARQKGAFFLGMDRMNPQFDRERNFVRQSAKKEDLEWIRLFIRNSSEAILEQSQRFGQLDVADSLCRVILVRFIEDYFGIPGPTETTMKNWLRALFYDLFLNFTNNTAKHQAAVDAANARKVWLLQLIKDRKQALREGQILDDNVLNRLILLQQEGASTWFDEDTLQRNMGGLITGILETTNKAVILVLDELFRRPEILEAAITCAREKDMQKMYGYVCEALRFNPVQPGVLRYNEKRQTLSGKGNKTYTIPAGSTIFALTAAAMMDPAAFPEPRRFDPGRTAVYMNYGYALHECYGKYINAVTISEFVAAVLRLPAVRRAPGRPGRGSGMQEGPFPNNFVVAFD
ncbi:MAG TPA: cytochrome P450 [Puia sp.]|jgi:cytochrome P450/glutathione S-transferase